jgi:hypothetical protein
MSNPVVESIISGNAPATARMAAARGMLPLPQADLLELLVHLRGEADADLARAAEGTLAEQNAGDLLGVAKAEDTAPAVLSYLASLPDERELHAAVVTHKQTPDDAVALLSRSTSDASLLDLIALNQQRLVRSPAIIEAILANPARSGEAERRVREIRQEFFEKERGARQIADELRARGKTAAAEFFEAAELTTPTGAMSVDDAWLIAQHIEVSDADIDDAWMARELIEEMLIEPPEQTAMNAQTVINAERLELGEVSPERISLIRRIMFMTVRDRVKLAMKGDREARGILIRDSNKVVAAGVIHNPRLTDQEVENIAAMRTVSDEVLRLIGNNRAWARSYPIIHNLARNPRTPLATAIQILPRIRAKDLKSLTQNRNISEAVRRQAYRLSEIRGSSS